MVKRRARTFAQSVMSKFQFIYRTIICRVDMSTNVFKYHLYVFIILNLLFLTFIWVPQSRWLVRKPWHLEWIWNLFGKCIDKMLTACLIPGLLKCMQSIKRLWNDKYFSFYNLIWKINEICTNLIPYGQVNLLPIPIYLTYCFGMPWAL